MDFVKFIDINGNVHLMRVSNISHIYEEREENLRHISLSNESWCVTKESVKEIWKKISGELLLPQ